MSDLPNQPEINRAWEGFLHARLALVRAWATGGESAAVITRRLNAHDELQIRSFIERSPDGGDKQRRIEWLGRELETAIAERQKRLDEMLALPYTLVEALAEARCPLDGYPLAKRLNPRLPVEARCFEFACRCGFSFTE